MDAKQKINIVWFKKDLRLRDHAPLKRAILDGLPTLLLYCFEPSLMSCPESDVRHWRFAFECITDLQKQLSVHEKELHYSHQEVISTLSLIAEQYNIENLYAYEEVGIKLTFDRDKAVKNWCNEKGIQYREFNQNGIIRGKQNRIGWLINLEDNYFTADTIAIDLTKLNTISISKDLSLRLSSNSLSSNITTYQPPFQKGGETYAWKYFKSFLKERYKNYSRQLSKPEKSRTSCSRLSPYLAFGCISSREVYQNISLANHPLSKNWNIKNFRSRLWWRSHFSQKLESQWQIESEPINAAFNQLDREVGGPLFDAWAKGQTGFPMVDASMRCLQATGWVNFRMRGMLVTFASYALWLDWRQLAIHLARLFLDFDPGIHYPQIQMQAGLSGYHTLRIFNPTVQVREHDQEGTFIKKWVPELRSIPTPHLAEPWMMTAMEQSFYQFELGKDYPIPIVDYDVAVAKNKDRYWAMRQSSAAKKNLPAIWQKFCTPKDIEKYKSTNDVAKL